MVITPIDFNVNEKDISVDDLESFKQELKHFIESLEGSYPVTINLDKLEHKIVEKRNKEIRDEHDVEADTVTDEGGGSLVCSGNVGINDLSERFDIHIEREGFETVGGYLLSHLGRMPYVGEQFEADGLLVEVLEVERRRINKIRLKRLKLSGSEESK